MREEIIIAPATASGSAAIAVIRLSGEGCIAMANERFKGKDLTLCPSHSIQYGFLLDEQGMHIDEVMVSLFHAPRSFTTEEMVEISCHGSPYIVAQILQTFIKAGARSAKPGEFTLRAFLHGRIDLSQAEAVADLIASESGAAHDIALKQMRGGFSKDIAQLREQLLHFASMLELELDFGEEDVEFADRTQLKLLLQKIQDTILPLRDSFRIGHAIKAGVNTVIAGKPNAGKSTLLNALLNEERAIVSDIPGTTRDTLEETLQVNGILFRFIDTAGLRETEDTVEKIGVARSYEKIKNAALLLYICDATTLIDAHALIDELNEAGSFDIPYLLIANKADQISDKLKEQLIATDSCILISAKEKSGIEKLKQALYQQVAGEKGFEDQTIVTNQRHFESLQQAYQAIANAQAALQEQRSSELIAQDLRAALDALAQISGAVTNDEILGTIFSKFCIGK
jgi:tRNA modification GTPase